MKKYIITLLLSFLCTTISILNASIEIHATHMTTDDGIANNTVRNIYQDSKGFIWIATLNGLSRYDGNSFVNFRPEESSVSLSDTRVKDIYEDNNGYLWINTTQEIFSCYDLRKESFVDFTGCGEYRQNYSHIMETSSGDIWMWHNRNGCRRVTHTADGLNSVSFTKKEGNIHSDNVNYVYEDEKSNIWVGTNNSVSLLRGNNFEIVETNHNSFKAISYGNMTYLLSKDGNISAKKESEPSRRVKKLSDNQDITVTGAVRMHDNILIFTNKGGYLFNMKSRIVTKDPRYNIINGEVQKDNRGNYWVNNFTGKAWYINSETGDVKRFDLIADDKVGYIDQERFHIVHDTRDIIWISTYGGGLFSYNVNTDELQRYTSDIKGTSYLTSNYLQNIMEDRSGSIWVCSEFTGLTRLSIMNEGALRIFPEDENLIDRSNSIRMITRLKNGIISIGTRTGGVYNYDEDMQPTGPKKHYAWNIYSVLEDNEGKKWLGSRGNGLSIDGKWYVNNPEDTTSLGDNNIFTMLCDTKGRMWIGTFGGGLNLAQYKDGKYSFTRYFNDNYFQSRVRALMQDKNGYIWLGTSDGVYVFRPEELISNPEKYIIYSHNNGKLKSNEVKCITEDSKGNIWIAMSGSGICRTRAIDSYENISFESFTETEGLTSNMAQSIIEDDKGCMWIATEYGISRYDSHTNKFENLFFSSYPLGNVYNENCACKTHDGKLLFGTNHGLVVISPDKIFTRGDNSPEVSFTNLSVNGVKIRPDAHDSPLKESVIYTDSLKLKHYHNSFVVEFSTFDYSNAGKTKYIYKLDNYDDKWSLPSSLNFASYKNLNPGTYKLHVKACNSSGIWGEKETTLTIEVKPPFWMTGWAFLFYLILTVTSLYIVFTLVKNFNSLRNRIHIEKEITEYKLVFFTNISHEFRTPLTLIQGALEKLQKGGRTQKDIAHSVKIMDKSTKRMLRLINQLLEFRKMQNNKLALSLEETDVMTFISEIFLSFRDAAESKNIDYRFTPSVSSYNMFIDKENIDKVVYNLLSNAFKYTPSGGKITVDAIIDNEKSRLVVSVSDTGVGIPKEKRGELFSRFMQSNFSGNSMGVGLHLSKELINVHKGTITYCENQPEGSVFTITVPTDKSVYMEADFLIPNNVILEEENRKVTEVEIQDDSVEVAEPLNKHKVLIIDDDDDVREFLKSEIGEYFEVAAEADGLNGLERAKNFDADLIVCDVLMPGMNGYEVTRKLKNDFDTSHIPVILLTAMSSSENHLDGIDAGAEAYITKPFSPKLLMTRIFKLIEQREKLKDKFSNDPKVSRPAICTSDKDKEFADKLQLIMDQQLTNAMFTVDDFASSMSMGRTMFYRKVRGVTGYSPNEYIRVVRMKKAAELLLENKFSVAEVSYKVGINDPFYFSKCFKAQFGVAPSVYLKGTDDTESKNSKSKQSTESDDANENFAEQEIAVSEN